MASTSATIDGLKTTAQDKKALKLKDINTKMRIASNIVKVCKMEAEADTTLVNITNINERVNFYTKADYYLIYKARVKQTMKFETPYSEIQAETAAALTNQRFFYEPLRKVYLDYLLNKRIVPKRDVLYKTVFSATPNCKQSHEDFKKSGFTWLKLPGDGNGITIEDPAQVQRRCKYLSKISKFRSEGRNIVYIDVRRIASKTICDEDYFLDFETTEQPPYLITVANKRGLIDLNFFDLNSNVFKFLINTLSVQSPVGTVFVIGERKLPEKEICPLPNEYSPKQEMFDFLQNNGIPCDVEMHRADLYCLIQRNKHVLKEKLYNIDDKLLSYRHEVLRRPFELPALSFFGKDFYKNKDDTKELGIKLNITKGNVVNHLHSYRSEDFQRMEDELIERERKIYTEDVKVEEIIDKIVMMARDGAIAKTDEIANLKGTELPDDRSDFIIP